MHEAISEPRLDIFVHNAAVTTSASIDETTPEDLDRISAANVRAPFLLTQRPLPMINDGGCVVSVSSAATRTALPELAYAMSKGAVEVFTRTLADSAGARNITVNAVAPGPTMTDTNPWMAHPEARARVAALHRVRHPYGRLWTADDRGWTDPADLVQRECSR